MQQDRRRFVAELPERLIDSGNQIRIAIFDDHALVRDALANALSAQPDFEVVATGSSAAEAVATAENHLPHLAILDVSMPGDGLQAALGIVRSVPFVKCVMLSSQDDEHVVSAALAAGAYAFLAKGISVQRLAGELRQVHRGQSYISAALAARLLPGGFGSPWIGDDGGEALIEITEREEQILRRLAQGFTVDEIGASIGLSPETVSRFLTNVLIKLHERSLIDDALAHSSG
jgi:two-component system nitrate/nitrite response regulator NarL